MESPDKVKNQAFRKGKIMKVMKFNGQAVVHFEDTDKEKIVEISNLFKRDEGRKSTFNLMKLHLPNDPEIL